MSFREDEPVESREKNQYGSIEHEESHPAFGVATVSRGSGTGRSLFQSDLLHRDTITLAIHTAERTRSLHRDWVHPRRELIEVEMSLAQWGALISSQGIGSGTPVTIRRTESTLRVPGIPHEPRTEQSIAEVEAKIGEMLAQARETLNELEAAIEGKRGIRATRDALRAHSNSIMHAEGNAAFAIKSVTEATEAVVASARADIEAHLLEAARLTGQEPSIEAPTFTRREVEQ
ncbi:hypothetical protein HOT74_gp79 [Microbacterium phage KaiHaiDragon]|uniref:Uncharacterized protein n=4 Tax=Caudoviricetes TaxID=2731619 RepID=A0A345MI09_9CAUD|nr:hypothetical protein HOT74_gp79 [Microbacterium phage KaiHaiDragon]AXH70190.1 hypothetical protein SEA_KAIHAIDRAGON_78 [Microbacterium phage KaiHaiDragon]QTF81594.1 hypothetical protein SEA_PULCHRA_79 [Microbacterium phage Pulchra]UVG34553.1 hypothetical protein EARICKHC_78 [Microbacterium phage EarickHC]WNM67780.1 hypothetical protein SEA_LITTLEFORTUNE_78 [Microbacterium phage LittleFortune]